MRINPEMGTSSFPFTKKLEAARKKEKKMLYLDAVIAHSQQIVDFTCACHRCAPCKERYFQKKKSRRVTTAALPSTTEIESNDRPEMTEGIFKFGNHIIVDRATHSRERVGQNECCCSMPTGEPAEW